MPLLKLDHELAPPVPSLANKIKEQVVKPAVTIVEPTISVDIAIEPTKQPPATTFAKTDLKTVIKEGLSPKITKPISLFDKTESGKIKMDDIKYRPRIFSPIEELKYMTLGNWRRISLQPNEVKEKIKIKINNLEKEGYDKKIAAIQAWKISPINQLYVDICRASLALGKSTKEILAEKRKVEPNYLTDEEFTVIIQLNQELKF